MSEDRPERDEKTAENERGDVEKRVRRASGAEPVAGFRGVTDDVEPRDTSHSTSSRDTPDIVRDEDAEAASERIETTQREGRGMGGTSTSGRTDEAEKTTIEKAGRDDS